MAGFGPWLIPDWFHLENHQVTLARGVRLSLAQRLSKRPDVSRVLTIIVFSASLVGSLPMGEPASRVSR